MFWFTINNKLWELTKKTLNLYFSTIFTHHLFNYKMSPGMYFQIISKWSTLSWHGNKWPNQAFQSVSLPVSLYWLSFYHPVCTLFLHSLTLHSSPPTPVPLAHSPAPTQLSQLDQETTPRHKQEVQVFSPSVLCGVCAAVPKGILFYRLRFVCIHFLGSFEMVRRFETSTSHEQNTFKI